MTNLTLAKNTQNGDNKKSAGNTISEPRSDGEYSEKLSVSKENNGTKAGTKGQEKTTTKEVEKSKRDFFSKINDQEKTTDQDASDGESPLDPEKSTSTKGTKEDTRTRSLRPGRKLAGYGETARGSRKEKMGITGVSTTTDRTRSHFYKMGDNKKESGKDNCKIKGKSNSGEILKKKRENEKENLKNDKEEELNRVRKRQEIELNERKQVRKAEQEKEQKEIGSTDNPSQAPFEEEASLPIAQNSQTSQTVLGKVLEQEQKEEKNDAEKEKETLEKSKILIRNKEKEYGSNTTDTMTEAERKKKKEGDEEGKDEQMEDKMSENGQKTGEPVVASKKIDGVHGNFTTKEGEPERNEKKN